MGAKGSKRDRSDSRINPDEVYKAAAASVKGDGSGWEGAWASLEGLGDYPSEDRARVVQRLPAPGGAVTYGAVIDGHSGQKCAIFLKARLHHLVVASEAWSRQDFAGALREGLAAADAEFLATGQPSGACVAVALTRGAKLWVAHAGDCRAVLCRGGAAAPLTEDHSVDNPNEVSRIGRARLIVDGRLFGIIAVTRSIGDKELKEMGEGRALIATPEVREVDLRLLPPGSEEDDVDADGRGGHDEFLILACDGIWDVLSNTEAVRVVRPYVSAVRAQVARKQRRKTAKKAAKKAKLQRQASGDSMPRSMSSRLARTVSQRTHSGGPLVACRRLVERARQKRSGDDCTAVVIPLPMPADWEPEPDADVMPGGEVGAELATDDTSAAAATPDAGSGGAATVGAAGGAGGDVAQPSEPSVAETGAGAAGAGVANGSSVVAEVVDPATGAESSSRPVDAAGIVLDVDDTT